MLANSKKNRNIKTPLNDYPLLSFVSIPTFVSKQCRLRKYVFVLQIDCMLLSMFCIWFVTLLEK